MAQRDKKEEPTELRAPEVITLCANSCGFPGNPATQNLCQNCFSAGQASPSPSPPSPSSSSSSSLPGMSVSPVVDRARPSPVEAPAELACPPVDRAPVMEVKAARTSVNRCSSCRKRVGLTGFRCRCGEMFCGEHRYSDLHGCSYDYKAAARNSIARDNPVVRAAKIVRF